MLKRLQPLEFKDLKTGLIMEGAVSRNQLPLDAVTDVVNLHFDEIGAATLRKGTTRLGDDAFSGDILGLYEFRDSGAGSNNQIIAVNGTVAYYLSGGTWTSKRTGLTTGSKAEFTTYLDYVFMVNGADATAVWDGNPSNSFVTTGNASGAPVGKYIENFRNRVWIAGNSTYPDRVYYSSLPSSVTTPVISWDTDVATGQWLDVSPSDGENITWLQRSKNALLVFKNNHIYRVYSINQSEPDPKIDVGTYSGRSVVEAKDGTYFHHPSGFYKYTDGGVQEISKPIQDIVENIALSNYTKVAGWEDGDHIYWSVGDITINGITISNTVVRYTISSRTWTRYSYPAQILVTSNYNDGSSLYRLVGDSGGDVLKVNEGLTDNGTNIYYSLTHRWLTLDGFVNTEKIISDISFEHDGGTGTKISYQIESSPLSTWPSLGQLGSNDSLLKTNIVCRRVRLMLFGVSVGEPFTYYGFEMPMVTVDNIDFPKDG